MGVPVHDDRSLLEFMSRDCMQAGLIWSTILQKREAVRKAFDGFKIEIVASYDDGKIDGLLKDKKIVRNKLKALAI